MSSSARWTEKPLSSLSMWIPTTRIKESESPGEGQTKVAGAI